MLRRLMITRGQEQIIEATSLSIKAVKLCADTVAVIVHVCVPRPVAYLHGLELVSCDAHDMWLKYVLLLVRTLCPHVLV